MSKIKGGEELLKSSIKGTSLESMYDKDSSTEQAADKSIVAVPEEKEAESKTVGEISDNLKEHESATSLPHPRGSVRLSHLETKLQEVLRLLYMKDGGLNEESDVTISGNLTVKENLTVNTNLSVLDQTTLHNTVIDGTLDVSGTIKQGDYEMWGWAGYSASIPSADWRTIAKIDNDRASTEFYVRDTQSGKHQTVHFIAANHYSNGSVINVLSNSSYSSGGTIKYIRILANGTYDGAAVQVYCDQATSVAFWMRVDKQSPGWKPVNWSTSSYGYSQKVIMELDGINPGMGTTGNFRASTITLSRANFGNSHRIHWDGSYFIVGHGSGHVYVRSSSNLYLYGGANVYVGDTSDNVYIRGNLDSGRTGEYSRDHVRGTSTTTMRDTSWTCFLVRMQLENEGGGTTGGRCRIYASGGKWYLQAYSYNDRAWCGARCIKIQ